MALAAPQGVTLLDYVIEMVGITKDFPGVRANDDITLRLVRGEIHALLGENGAGKSTLMSVLFGLYQPDSGDIRKNGAPVVIRNPNDANAAGIGMVHQHFKLVHNMTVLENIILGVETVRRGVLRMDEARRKVVALSERYGLRIDPDARIEDSTVGMQQRVEILKMLYRDNEVLIFDEPTAVLTPQEIEEMMRIMRSLAREGKSILFITHKLNEIKDLADRCTVLRKGRLIGTVDVASVDKQQLSEMMVGRKVNFSVEKQRAAPGEPILALEHVFMRSRDHQKPLLDDISFVVRRGEIATIAGIDGNGQSELVYAITGLADIDSGRIVLHGEDISRAPVKRRNDMHLSHIPEDRHKHGLILDFSLAENLLLKNYRAAPYQRHGFIRFDAVSRRADSLIEQFDIRAGQGGATSARSMSGGNQQKAIVAREISLEPDLLVAVQPTRGLDVGAIEYIHKQLIAARDRGCAVLLISLELDEVKSLSDTIHVIYEGRLVANFDPDAVSIQEIGLYMAGSKRGSAS
jgi:ABC-type uncharacterized transport system ATPase subunit